MKKLLGALLLLVSGTACSSSQPTPTAIGETQAACQTETAADVSFDLVFPRGYGLSQVAVGASDELVIQHQTRVLAADGVNGSTVTSAGRDPLTVGADSYAGAIVSTGDIILGSRVTAKQVTSSHVVQRASGDQLGAVSEGAVLTPLVRRTITFHRPAGTRSDVIVAPGSSATLAPGLYGNVSIKGIATVVAGTYDIEHFYLASGAELHLDTSGGGTVGIYVEDGADLDGKVTGDASWLTFAYLGTETATLGTGFSGTAFVPHGTLRLFGDSLFPSTTYHGTFFGKRVVLGRGMTVQKLTSPTLIDRMEVSQTTVCTGDEIEVSVDTGGSAPDATVWIEGVVGNHQFVQVFGSPGIHRVSASVQSPDGRADYLAVPITVQSCAPSPVPPIVLNFRNRAGPPNTVEFMVYQLDAKGHEVLMNVPAMYTWTFGDGQTTTTDSPLQPHNYTAAVNPLLRFNYVTASVTVVTSVGTATAQKVVPLFSLYAQNRAKGIIQPPSSVLISPTGLSLQVTNYETSPISITGALLELLPCDPALPARPLPPQTLAATIPASARGTVSITNPTFPIDVCAIGFHLLGSAQSGKVYSDAYLRVKENPLTRQTVTDPSTIALLNQAASLAADPNRIGEQELRQLVARGKLSRLPPPIPRGSTYANAGDECTPGTTTAGLDCVAAPEWVADPPEIVNGLKGHFLMQHACSSIGHLLAAIHQLYSHSLIMTKNRVEVRHSTDSEDRLGVFGNLEVLGTNGIDEDILRFGWPGTIGTGQTTPPGRRPVSVDEVVHGYALTDPLDDDDSFTISGDLYTNPQQVCSGDITIVPPVVVRPIPGGPAIDLQPVVDQALSIQGHYRFYMYSQGDRVANLQPAPGSDSWAAGTEPTTCSSFLQMAASRAGLKLWTASGNALPDGMRRYGVDDRFSAGHALYDNIWKKADSQCSGIPVVGMACSVFDNRVANQMVNCFANDGCGDRTSTWEDHMQEGVAVSPDDILNWDGAYNYVEPLVYVDGLFRHKYVWKAKAGDGAIKLRVVDGTGKPAQATTRNGLIVPPVILLDGQEQQLSPADAGGNLEIQNVPAGSHTVAAQLYTGPDLPLQPPAPVPADAILDLPACPYAEICQTRDRCLPGFGQGACIAGGYDSYCGDNPEYGSSCSSWAYDICVCYALPTPPPSCDFYHASKPVTVVANGETSVLITLCVGVCTNGLPGSCLQACNTDSDCDNNQTCSCGNSPTCDQTQCHANKAVVRVTTKGFTGVELRAYDANGTGPGIHRTSWPEIDFTCDPFSSNNTTGWGECLQAGDEHTEMRFTVICTADPYDETGGIHIVWNIHTMDGCGPGAEEEDAAIDGTFDVAFGAVQVLGAGKPGHACFSDAVDPADDICTENGTLVNGIGFISQLRQ